MDRPATAPGPSTMRMLMLGWALSAVLLVAGLLLLFTGTVPVVGIVLFVLGAISATTVTVGLLRLKARAGIGERAADGDRGPGGATRARG